MKRIKEKKQRCDSFEARHRAITEALSNLGDGGLIVKHVDFFKYAKTADSNLFYFKVTHKINLDLIIKDVHRLPEKDRLFAMMTAAFALSILHDKQIIHFDIKPDNILVHKYGETSIAKIIDFDDSLFVGKINHEEITGDTTYYSPELNEYKKTEGKTAPPNCQSDIFALGLVFCQYWTGKLPDHESGSAAEAVLKGKKLVVGNHKKSRVRTNIKSAPKIHEKPSIIKLIEDMLSLEHTQRPSAIEVHSRLKQIVNEVK
ncbi:Protein kinase domain-containing protein [Limnospira platensis C1]|nr:Protein kinase domain-containing protein [Arthrospira platensis C1]